MPYQMETILNQCEPADFELIADLLCGKHGFSDHIYTTFNLTATKTIEKLLRNYNRDNSDENKRELIHRLEREIRYLGSNDLATAARRICSEGLSKHPSGVSFDEMIMDVSKVLKIKQKRVGTPEDRLKHLVAACVERTFNDLSPENQRKIFRESGLKEKNTDTFFDRIKNNKQHVIQAIIVVFDNATALKIITNTVVSLVAKVTSQKTATIIATNIMKEYAIPTFFVDLLAPLNIIWIASSLASPAYRKTVPILLWLGVIAIRSDVKKDDNTWVPTDE